MKKDYHSNHKNHIVWAEISLKGNSMNVSVRFERTKKNNKYITIIRKDINYG